MNRKAAYAEYLKSERWRALREAARQRDGNACRLCDGADSLEVHHRRYPDVFGTESVDDLTTLCADCHGAFHARLPREMMLVLTPEVRRTAPAVRLETAHVEKDHLADRRRSAAPDEQRHAVRSALPGAASNR